VLSRDNINIAVEKMKKKKRGKKKENILRK
jgi:hypothetical protein